LSNPNVPAVYCEGIGKRYRIGERQLSRSLRETVTDALRAPFRTFQEAPETDVLWALKDISLEIHHGEVLGILGRNGSGKSTLLKILSRITKPTEGRAEIRGRVGVLLAVGTGFHPELTGRENIYLNGTLLGMEKGEITRKFEEIVEFSEIGRFLDTPVKHYSSGMYMRLAFSVAAHLETEILFVDEVLSVGDSEFQKKSLRKMRDAALQGRTVLFVSHSLLSVETLCTRAICLQEGRLVAEGLPGDVIASYLHRCIPAPVKISHEDFRNAPGNHAFRLRRLWVHPVGGSPADPITVRTPFVVEVEYWKLISGDSVEIWAELSNEHGIHLFDTGWLDRPPGPPGLLRSSFVVPGNLLNNGIHQVEILVSPDSRTHAFRCSELLTFEVRDSMDGLRGEFLNAPWPGAIRPELPWTTTPVDEPSTVVSSTTQIHV
jgi:lipopolysaccharide transport system ATP-binding protein